jgi:SnoaL-like domain
MSYIDALDRQRYKEAMDFPQEGVRIRAPAGEAFGKPLDFIEMLRKYKGRYDIKKVFVDGNDVCVLYDLATTGPAVYMSSWYEVENGKIVSINTVFDPRAFGTSGV